MIAHAVASLLFMGLTVGSIPKDKPTSLKSEGKAEMAEREFPDPCSVWVGEYETLPKVLPPALSARFTQCFLKIIGVSEAPEIVWMIQEIKARRLGVVVVNEEDAARPLWVNLFLTEERREVYVLFVDATWLIRHMHPVLRSPVLLEVRELANSLADFRGVTIITCPEDE